LKIEVYTSQLRKILSLEKRKKKTGRLEELAAINSPIRGVSRKKIAGGSYN
jgi:hypothetical protein